MKEGGRETKLANSVDSDGGWAGNGCCGWGCSRDLKDGCRSPSDASTAPMMMTDEDFFFFFFPILYVYNFYFSILVF